MKTKDMIQKYKHGDAPPRADGWERLLWMAANLIKMVEQHRHTYRNPRGKTSRRDNRQMEFELK